MTSVQNLRLLLSGNKFGFFIIFLVCYSCGTPVKVVETPKVEKPVNKPEVYNPKTGQMETANSSNTHVDTIHFIESGLEPFIKDKPNINAGEKITKGAYDIALLLPLSEDDLGKDMGSDGSEKYFQYYAGMRLGMKALADSNYQTKIHVLDVKANPEDIYSLFKKPAVANADLIIGPLRRDHINETAKFVLQNNKVMVAPWNAYRTIENINDHYVLMRASLPTHCEALTHYALSIARPQDICIVGREKSKTITNYFVNNIQKSTGNDDLKISQSIIKDDYKFGESYKYLDSTKSVYMITEFEDPNIVFNFLRNINAMRKNRDITVIGMPSWQDYPKDFMSLFNALKVTISSNSFADGADENVIAFRKLFFQAYQNFPSKEAYEGYDVIQYLIKALAQRGTSFQLDSEAEPYEGIATKIKLEKILDLTKGSDDRMKNTLCIENKALYILRFDQFKFSILQ